MPETRDHIAKETRALIMDAKDNVAVAIRGPMRLRRRPDRDAR